ncbi:MAG TPA: hypothetical protein VMZ22_11090 [Acidimicrobiales bacterium]|nr:hypothetical protein [Acidimicrobiales bacterium]
MSEPADEPTAPSGADPRLSAAAAHVQNAGLELIAAVRNALDIAEDLIADPHALQVLLTGAVEAAKIATQTVTTATAAASQIAADKVQRIRVDD